MKQETRDGLMRKCGKLGGLAMADAVGIAMSQIDAAERAGEEPEITITTKTTVGKYGAVWHVDAGGKSQRAVAVSTEKHTDEYDPDQPELPGTERDTEPTEGETDNG